MKRTLLFFFITIIGGLAWAGSPQSVWRSSFTQTADTTKNLCGADAGIVTNRRGFLHSVCISSPVAAASISVFNSSATTINPITVIDASTKGCLQYDVVASTVNKGLTYSTVGTANVNILYDCY